MRPQCPAAAEWAEWIFSPHLKDDDDRKALGFLRAFFRQIREAGMQQILRRDKHRQQAMPHFCIWSTCVTGASFERAEP
jgi:hypothetical protein